jgi:Sec-independent protein secretion pathway component TatC
MSTTPSDWKSFMRRHWGAVVIFIVGAALVFAWAVYVFWWFVGTAQSSGMVPSTLGLWTMANLVTFILYSIFWELLLVGIPVAIAAVVAWQWWKRLPAEERMGYHFGRRSRSAGGSGGVSLVLFIAFCIKVSIDGKWNVAISTFTLNYVVGSMITILAWLVVIFGIPIAIGLTWWIRHEMQKA